ncbi:MAG: hypothetical protein QM808_16085 [Steroidobacteraceae bacterium]
MSHSALCWRCGASFSELTLPLSRLDICKQCRAELHACKQCLFYDITVAKQCREPIAEEVRDKQRANYCDYFSLRADAYQPVSSAAQQARAQLDALFGAKAAVTTDDKPDATAAARAALDDLFGKKS